MAKAVAGLPPATVRDVIVRNGWSVVEETDHIWLLAPDDDPIGVPISIPKHGHIVDPDVMNWLCREWPVLGTVLAHELARFISERT